MNDVVPARTANQIKVFHAGAGLEHAGLDEMVAAVNEFLSAHPGSMASAVALVDPRGSGLIWVTTVTYQIPE